jgi:hypothetical protein
MSVLLIGGICCRVLSNKNRKKPTNKGAFILFSIRRQLEKEKKCPMYM